MKKLLFIITFLLFFFSFLKGHHDYFSYISPGLQIGYNTQNGFFYGGQVSIGVPEKFYHLNH